MSEELKKVRTLLSDPKVLHKIKFIQFRRQLLPILAILVLMAVNFINPQNWMLYPILAAFGWYLLERILLRTKNKIAEPEATAFVCPVDGKVTAVRKGEDMTSLTIRKSWLDVAEVRLPYPGLQADKPDSWKFDTRKGQIVVKIKAGNFRSFENFPVHGGVIGVIIGSGQFSLYLPSGLKVLVQENQTVFGGETELFSLAENAETEEAPKSILVEEPLEEMDNPTDA
jgi:hypothetical protein